MLQSATLQILWSHVCHLRNGDIMVFFPVSDENDEVVLVGNGATQKMR